MSWDLLGHTWAVELLAQHIQINSVRHAYLFTGPRGVGRRTLALLFAQAINCTNPPAAGEACGTCRSCQLTARLQHPDLAFISTEQMEGSKILVEQIRDLQRSLALAPYEARYRIAMLLNFEEATNNTANALLKTLEEPSPQVVLLLTAESPERLLPTIVSRCEVLRLRPLSMELLSQGLQDRLNLPLMQADLLAHLSTGRPGYAIRLHQQPELLEQRAVWIKQHITSLSQGMVDRFAWVNTIYRDKEGIREVLQVLQTLWRDVLLRAAGSHGLPVNQDFNAEIKALAEQVGMPAAHQAVASIDRTLESLERNVNARLALEVLMLDLPRVTAARSSDLAGA